MFCFLSPNHLWLVYVSLHFADALSVGVHEMKENKLYQHYQNREKFCLRSPGAGKYYNIFDPMFVRRNWKK